MIKIKFYHLKIVQEKKLYQLRVDNIKIMVMIIKLTIEATKNYYMIKNKMI